MVRHTLLKTLSYAVMHMSISISISYLLTGSWEIALAIGLLEPCVQTVGFFFHERAWHRFEKKTHRKDYHDSVIDSVSPASGTVERLLHRLYKAVKNKRVVRSH